MQYVPVVSKTGKPLMPCHPARARELVRKGRAARRFRKGFFYVQLLDREDGAVQPVACGIDPGSKFEGLTVKSAGRTFVNIHVDAVTHVKEAMKARRDMRPSRRYRKTPCRKPRYNHARGGLPSSATARWGSKLKLARFLAGLYPISVFVVEDVRARTRKSGGAGTPTSPRSRRGRRGFTPSCQQWRPWFLCPGTRRSGLREERRLSKAGDKSAETFWAHCVDSWVLAASAVGGLVPDSTRIVRVAPLRFRRRSLRLRQVAKGGIRRRHGGTVSLGRRGTQVLYPRFGFCYVGGHMGGRLSLHSMRDGKRLTQRARLEDCAVLCSCSWRVWVPEEHKTTKGGKAALLPVAEVRGFRAARF